MAYTKEQQENDALNDQALWDVSRDSEDLETLESGMMIHLCRRVIRKDLYNFASAAARMYWEQLEALPKSERSKGPTFGARVILQRWGVSIQWFQNFRNPKTGKSLYKTLTLPSGSTKFPARSFKGATDAEMELIRQAEERFAGIRELQSGLNKAVPTLNAATAAIQKLDRYYNPPSDQ